MYNELFSIYLYSFINITLMNQTPKEDTRQRIRLNNIDKNFNILFFHPKNHPVYANSFSLLCK